MGFCSKCGKEIDDNREVCADCEKLLDDQGESYLDSLLDSIAPNWGDDLDTYNDENEIYMPPEEDEEDEVVNNAADASKDVVAMETPVIDNQDKSKQEKMDNNEDISELMDLLSNTTEDSEEPAEPEPELVLEDLPEPEPEPEPEKKVEELVREPEEPSKAKGYDDIFSDALSAINYMEDEDETKSVSQPDETSEHEEPIAIVDDENLTEPFSEEPTNEPITEDTPVEPKTKLQAIKAKLFDNIVDDDIAAAELKENEEEEAEKNRLKEEKEKKKEEDKEKKELKKEQDKEKKELAKKTKEEQLAKKKAAKLEQQALLQSQVQGKINPVGAGIVAGFFVLIGAVIIIVTMAGKYGSAITSSEKYFEDKNYEEAYNAISGISAKEADSDQVEKIRICMSIKKEWNSYNNYYHLKMYLQAVDSLVKGVRKSGENTDRIEALSIEDNVKEMDDMFIKKLADEYHVSEQKVKELISMTDRSEYTKNLQQIIDDWENEL